MNSPDPSSEESADAAHWEAVANRPAFRELLRAKKRFIVPACLFFLVYYFALTVLVGYFPGLSQKKIGPANLAYWFALSQFFMAWAVAMIYVRAANRFDRRAHEILEEKVSREKPSTPSDAPSPDA